MAMRTRFLALFLLFFVSPLPAWSAEPGATETGLPPLRDFLASVRENGPSVRAARLRQGAAEAFVKQAGLPPNPALEVRTENWRFDDSFSSHDDLDVVVSLTQSLELGGKAGARKRAARAGADVLMAERQRAEIVTILDATRLYLGLIRVADHLQTFGERSDALERVVQAMRQRVEEGYSAEADLKKFETEKALSDDRLIRGQSERREILAAMQVLSGRSIPSGVPMPADPPLPVVPELSEPERKSRFLKTSPEVAAARSRLAQAGFQLEGEKARRVPNLDLTAGYKRTGGLDTGVAGLVAAVPLFDSNAGAVTRAKLEAEAASVEARAAEDAEWMRFQSLWETTRELRERALTVERDLIVPARTVRDSARVAFKEGAADMLGLLDAERVYSEARSTALQLRHDAFLKTLEIRLLLGEEALP